MHQMWDENGQRPVCTTHDIYIHITQYNTLYNIIIPYNIMKYNNI